LRAEEHARKKSRRSTHLNTLAQREINGGCRSERRTCQSERGAAPGICSKPGFTIRGAPGRTRTSNASSDRFGAKHLAYYHEPELTSA
jgi:hypothetical protein